MNSLNKSMLSFWKLQDETHKQKQKFSKQIVRLLKNINKELKVLCGNCETFNETYLCENLIHSQGIYIHAFIPDYPDLYVSMGVFLIRLEDKNRELDNKLRFVLNLNKVNNPKQIAQIFVNLLKNPLGEYKKYYENGTLLTEKEAKSLFLKELKRT